MTLYNPSESNKLYFGGITLFIFMILLVLAHAIAAYFGNYPILGSPIILYVVSLFFGFLLQLHGAPKEYSKKDKLDMIVMLSIVTLILLFLRTMLFLPESISLLQAAVRLTAVLFSLTIVNSIMFFGVYPALALKAKSRGQHK